MVRTLENIVGYRLLADDGEIGKVYDFFLDDALWHLRYLVVETGNWLHRRRVLIAPSALGAIHGDKRDVCVKLKREQVQHSPDIDTEKPVSRQQEILTNAHYGWPAYWAPEAIIVPDPTLSPALPEKRSDGDPHLRSFREISSYRILRGTNAVGTAQDFIIDDETWTLKHMVAIPANRSGSRPVMVPVETIGPISWSGKTMRLLPSAEELTAYPPFDPHAPVNREVKVLHLDYYGRPAKPK